MLNEFENPHPERIPLLNTCCMNDVILGQARWLPGRGTLTLQNQASNCSITRGEGVEKNFVPEH